MSNSASSSWVVPFVLGAASAASLLWLSQKSSSLSESPTKKVSGVAKRSLPTSTSKSSSRKEEPLKAKSVARSSQASNGDATDELMDSVELDNRMLRKAEAVIQWRTTRLVLVVERCTNDHNYSAILRTAEALGIQVVYMIDPPEILDEEEEQERLESLNQQQRRHAELRTPEEAEARRQHHLFARKATEWLTVKDCSSSEECVAELREQGYQLWVTDLSQEAQSLTMTSPAIPEKVALVMGTEAVGCSQYMLDEADRRVYLPLRGFADSLNLSVATALIIHQLFVMDPTMIGGISEEEKYELRQVWYTKLCQQRILTSGQRKQRTKLQNLLRKCQTIYDRSQKTGARKLQPSEQKKLNEWDTYKAELQDFENMLDPVKLQAAVQEWVENPPVPLTDVRRADAHRVCYVGKGTKAQHQDHWKDMVATSNAQSVHLSTAAAFREKVKAQENE